MYHEAVFPLKPIQEVITAVRSGDYTSTETVDSAIEAAGCLNALRGPNVFGAAAPDYEGHTLPQLADELEQHAAAYSPPVAGEPEPVQAIDWGIVLQIVLVILDRLRKE